MAKVDCDIKS